MNSIKHIMGLIIIALAIYLAYPIINLGNSLLSIGVLCFITALAFLLIKQFRSPDLELLIHKIMPMLMIVIGLVFTVLSSQKPTTATPSSFEAESVSGGYILNTSQLDKQVAASDKPVIIIISAKWCAICRELEATTFKDRNVLDKFQQFTIIHFDITDNQPDSSTVLNRYKLYGPPAIIILDKNKTLQDTITGYISAKDLIKRLKY
jgi:thiol:disulfide interchange protein DsbD